MAGLFLVLGPGAGEAEEEGTASREQDLRLPETPPGGLLPPDYPEAEVSSPDPERLAPPRKNLEGRGLLDFRDPFPLALLHLQIPNNTLQVLEEGEWKVRVSFDWANSFAADDNFIIDAETYVLELSAWYALDRDFYVGAGLPVMARSGGILDPVIDGFHNLFGLSDGGRDDVPRNDYEISITDENGQTASLDSGIGLGDLSLKAHWILNEGGRWFPAVSVQALVNLPTSTQGFGSDGVDLGLVFSAYKTFLEIVHLYGVVGVTYLTDPRTEGLRYDQLGATLVAGVEVAVLDELSIVLQTMYYSGLLESISPLDDSRYYVAFGFKWQVIGGIDMQLSIVENFNNFESSSDLALGFGLAFRF
jgi:hypothetical protein